MSEKDLIHLKPKGDEYSDGIRAKLKGSGSDKRKLAQSISALKRANPDTIERRAMEIVANPKTSALEIMRYIQIFLQQDNLDDALKIQVIGKLIQAHTAIFGNINVNANIGMDFETMYAQWLEKREEALKNDK